MVRCQCSSYNVHQPGRNPPKSRYTNPGLSVFAASGYCCTRKDLYSVHQLAFATGWSLTTILWLGWGREDKICPGFVNDQRIQIISPKVDHQFHCLLFSYQKTKALPGKQEPLLFQQWNFVATPKSHGIFFQVDLFLKGEKFGQICQGHHLREPAAFPQLFGDCTQITRSSRSKWQPWSHSPNRWKWLMLPSPKTNSQSPWKWAETPKRKFIFQPLIFRGHVSFREGTLCRWDTFLGMDFHGLKMCIFLCWGFLSWFLYAKNVRMTFRVLFLGGGGGEGKRDWWIISGNQSWFIVIWTLSLAKKDMGSKVKNL